MTNEIRLLNAHEYPKLINEIPDPPSELYMRGNLPKEDNVLLCVVGSRKYSQYGKSTCQHLITGLKNLPVTIVSGLALGIDGLAHQSAIKAGLQTIAVPGSGLDDRVLYPASHRNLALNILKESGGLLSEYKPDFKATVWSFPKRNRIMAGMSHATLVIEANEKSGTLITARLAYEYNRDVLTVPGSIFSQSSAGPHKLIRDGAIPISSTEDLISALNIETEKKNQTLSKDDCTPNEQKLIEELNEPKTRDELAVSTNLTTQDINVALTLLEMKGYTKEELGKIFLL